MEFGRGSVVFGVEVLSIFEEFVVDIATNSLLLGAIEGVDSSGWQLSVTPARSSSLKPGLELLRQF